MKTYNTICGIICIILLIAALVFAAHKNEEATETTKATTTMQSTVKANEPQPQPYIRYQLTENERDIVERVVMTESGGEPIQGQMAVAQCILNTAEATGMRPDAVVLAPGQYAPPASSASTSVKAAVVAVFDHGQTVTDEPIRYFYAPKYSPGRWHESALTHVITIGGHKFFKIPN